MTVKNILCLVLVLSLLVVPVSADNSNFYTLDPVVSSSLLDSGSIVAPMAATSWDTSDSSHLTAIYNAMVNGLANYNSNSILGILYTLRSNSNSYTADIDSILTALNSNQESSILGYLHDIEYSVEPIRTYISNLSLLSNITGYQGYIQSDVDSIESSMSTVLSRLASILTGISNIDSTTQTMNSTLSFFKGSFDYIFGTGSFVYGMLVDAWPVSWSWVQVLSSIPSALVFDGNYIFSGERTLYGRVKQLQEVLASDDDLALANSQKENREEIEDSFLSGSSGTTSLGASDFGALSDVGGAVKETISLNGQSSIGDFTSGLAGADEAGQGWFSEFTRAALDSVSSASSYSLRGDPYNMAGWQDRYAWVVSE